MCECRGKIGWQVNNHRKTLQCGLLLLHLLGLNRAEISKKIDKQMDVTGQGSQSRACVRHLV